MNNNNLNNNNTLKISEINVIENTQKQVFDVSIVIVNYNVKDYLNQCLRSIQDSVHNLQIQTIVVDNYSTDNSIPILSPLFPNVIFISLNQNVGFSKANNIGFSYSNSKYTLILNPDTVLSTDTLQTMFDLMEQNINVGLSGCKVLNADGSFQLPCRRGFPTPWVAFTKLFGLQAIFPKVKLFAGYNLTYLDEDKAAEVDALIGAFMFVRTNLLKKINGFDEDFFMYGDDIDLCYRIHKTGYKILYYPQTTTIHFKGESTRRSNIDELYHFYEAMKIYTKKHYSSSKLFLLLLNLGINLRYFLAGLAKYKSDVKYILTDIFFVNSSLLIATKIVKGEFFWFPQYAYPKVFFIVPFITFFAKFSIGEYFEGGKSALRTIYAQLIVFFILSSLTYFFKDYAFSRGVILVLIALSTFVMLVTLFFDRKINIGNKFNSPRNHKRILIIGDKEKARDLVENIEIHEKNSEIVGFIYDYNYNYNIPSLDSYPKNNDYQYLGHIDYLPKILQDYLINEVIVTSAGFDKKMFTSLKYRNLDLKNKIHFISAYKDLQVSRVYNVIESNVKLSERDILPLRYRFYKRTFDIIVSLFFLTIGFPLLYLFSASGGKMRKEFSQVLKNSYSVIGVEICNEKNRSVVDNVFKKGIITLNNTFLNSEDIETVKMLDKIYTQHYSLSLDFELLIKFLVNKSGNKNGK